MMKKLLRTVLSATMLCSMAVAAFAANSNQMVKLDLWNASSNQPSMGNIATDNNPYALYNPDENTLQIATNPVDVSGYMSGIVAARYDTTGKGDYDDVEVLTTFDMETGTKNDGTNHNITILSSFEIEIPDYLTKEGIEYIPLQMSVPHTPMDVVVGTGYLDAKLRINWDDMKATSDKIITSDTTMSAGSVKGVNLKSSGILVNANTTVMPENTKMKVTKITAGADFDLAQTALAGKTFELYKMELTAGGKAAQITGTMEIIFPYAGSLELYRINDNGTKTVLRGAASDENYTILSRSAGLFAIIGGEKQEQFSDISTHWANANIETAVDKGLFNGTSDTTFSPDGKMTAGMVITVLHRIAGSPMTANDGATWYSEAVAWGYAQGIIGGYKAFDGNANVTREELATMLYRYDGGSASGDLSKFTDVGSISNWAKDGLSWANAKGIVTGKTATTIAPQTEATRAEVATMLVRYVDGGN